MIATNDTRPPTEPVRQYRFRLPPGACDLLLVRHGESRAAVPGEPFPSWEGQSDPSLADVGVEEAQAVADRLEHAGVEAIWTTPLVRTQQTAAPLAERLGLEPQVAPDLREVFMGDWEGGEYRHRAAAGDPLVARVVEEQDWGLIDGAESMADFAARVRRGIEAIAAVHRDQRVVAVVHGGVIGAALAMAAASAPFTFVAAANASISHLVVTPDRWILRRFNDTAHLDTDLDAPV